MIFFSPRQVVPTFDIKVDRSVRSKKKKKNQGFVIRCTPIFAKMRKCS